MKNLIKKLKNKKGFTLMEMLIVVAIMVILVAVSIPIFTNQLGQAKKATDDANERAAKSQIVTQYLLASTGEVSIEADKWYWYDAENGLLITTAEASSKNKPTAYSQVESGKCVKAKIDSSTGAAATAWE